MIRLRQGQEYRGMRVTDTYREDKIDGAVIERGGGPLIAKVQCKHCGTVVEVNCDEAMDKPHCCIKRVQRSGVVLYLDLNLQVRIDRLVQEKGMTKSAAAEMVLQRGFELLEMRGEV